MATYRAFLNLYNENDEKNTYLPYTDMDAVYSQNGYDDLIGTSHNIVKSSSPLTLRNALKVINKAVYDLKDGAFLPKVTTTTPYPGDSAVVTPNMVYQVQQDLNNKITALNNKINNSTSGLTDVSEVYDLLVNLLYSNSALKSTYNSSYTELFDNLSPDEEYYLILGTSTGPYASFSDLKSIYKERIIIIRIKLYDPCYNNPTELFYSLNLSTQETGFGMQRLRFLFGIQDASTKIFNEKYFNDRCEMINTFSTTLILNGKYNIGISFNEAGNLKHASKFDVYTYASPCYPFEHV